MKYSLTIVLILFFNACNAEIYTKLRKVKNEYRLYLKYETAAL